MIARSLRSALALIVALAALGLTALVSSGAEPVVAVGLSLACLAIVASLPMVVVIVLARRASREAAANGPALGPRLAAQLRSAPREWLVGLIVFAALLPFERLWMPRLRAASGQSPAVLLVHGYACNAGLWRWMRRGLIAAGYEVGAVTLEPPFAGIETSAERLRAAIEEFAATAPGGRVALVCHSMGGLVARAYLGRYGTRRVAKLITIGAPHAGTRIARYGVGRNAREMAPDSSFLRNLPNPAALGVATAAIWSEADMIVVPPEGARLPGAAEYRINGLGHLALAFSLQVLRLVERELGS